MPHKNIKKIIIPLSVTLLAALYFHSPSPKTQGNVQTSETNNDSRIIEPSHLKEEKEVAADIAKNEAIDALPDDLKDQYTNPKPSSGTFTQHNMPQAPQTPPDILHSLQTPPRKATLDEVNN